MKQEKASHIVYILFVQVLSKYTYESIKDCFPK